MFLDFRSNKLNDINEEIFGIAVNVAGFYEQRHLYTRKQMQQYDAFIYDYPSGGYSAELTPGIMYVVSAVMKNDSEIREFLLNRNRNELLCNSPDPECADDVLGSWIIEERCLFTNMKNPTTEYYINKLHILPSERQGRDSRLEQFKGEFIYDQMSELYRIFDAIKVACKDVKEKFIQIKTEGNVHILPIESVKRALDISDPSTGKIRVVTDDGNSLYIPILSILWVTDGNEDAGERFTKG